MNTHADGPGDRRLPGAGFGRDAGSGARPGSPAGSDGPGAGRSSARDTAGRDATASHTAGPDTAGAGAPGAGRAAGGSHPDRPSSSGPVGDAGGDVGSDAGGPAIVESELETARRERDEYLDMVRRLQADFENYKKRTVRQQTDQLERAAEHLVTNLLPALDAFDMARAHLGELAHTSTEAKALLQASALLTDTLAKEGLERIDESGVPFDPTTHDAVEHAPVGDAGSGSAGAGAGAADGADGAPSSGDPVVTGVLRSGYRWKGRVVRPAMVRVAG